MSEPVDLVVENARVVTPSGVLCGGVAADGGVITRVSADADLPDATEMIDADGRHLLPGFVDPHTHVGINGGTDPATYHPEFARDVETETLAALHGGTTTLLTFLNQRDPYAPDMGHFVGAGNDRAYVDFGFHAVVHGEAHANEMATLAGEWGVRSFKLFFDRYRDTPAVPVSAADAGAVLAVLERAADIPGAVVMVHAENEGLVTARERELRASGRDDLAAWADASPGVAQAMQIEQLGMLTERADATAYVVHNSMAETIPALRRYQERGVRLHGETLASFLVNDSTEDLGTWGKISPPIGSPGDQDALWRAVRTGVIDHVGTDHCPHDYGKKGERHDPIWEARPGDQVLEAFLPIVLTAGVDAGRVGIERVVEVCAANNAKRFGLYPEKGAIQEGSDADLVVVDLHRSVTVDDDFYHGREHRWSSVHGKQLTGLPTHVIQGGELAVHDGELLVEAGRGEYLPRRV